MYRKDEPKTTQRSIFSVIVSVEEKQSKILL